MTTDPKDTSLTSPDERLGLPSASSLEIAVKCAGMPNLRRTLPAEVLNPPIKSDADEWADRGTRIHAAYETGNTDDLDQEEAATYQAGLAFEESIVQNWLKDKALTDCEEGPRELRVFLNHPQTLEPIGSAKMDRHYIAPPYLLDIDFKTGWNPNLSPSARSWQLRFQAVLLWKEYEDRGIKEIRVAHCKPKDKAGADDVCDYSEQDLIYSLQSIVFHLWETTQPDAPRHAGHHCNWCPCKAWCIEAGAYAMMPAVIARRADKTGLSKWDMMADVMTGEDLLRVWETSSIVDKITDAVKDRLKAMTTEQLKELGIALGKGRKLDAVANIPGAFKFLEDKGFAQDVVLKTMKCGKGALVEAIMLHLKTNKASADMWWNEKLDPYIVRETSAAPLVRLK